MKFIQDLSEAKLFGSGRSGVKFYNGKDIADLLFLHICALQILKHEFYGLPEAQAYLYKVGPITNFDQYIQSRNEIYALLHILIGKYSGPIRAKLKDQVASEEFLENVWINIQHMRKYLRLILAGKADAGFERQFLLELERGLMIDNSYYRSIRRLASSWNLQSESTKKLVMTRLLQVFRSKARRSELLPILEKVAHREELAIKNLEPIEGEGLGQNEPKTGMDLLKTLALTGAGFAAGYHLTRNKKK